MVVRSLNQKTNKIHTDVEAAITQSQLVQQQSEETTDWCIIISFV